MAGTNRKSRYAASAAVTALLMAGAAQAEVMVALLLLENVTPRWEQQDAAVFVETMAELAPEATVEIYNTNNGTATEQRQAEQR